MVREREGFFVVGGTLGSDTESYIPRSADRALYDSLRKGDFAYVLDSRQKGKSSLMIRTRKALESEGIRTVLLDLQRFGSNLEPEQWYASLLLGAGEELGIEDRVLELWDSQRHSGPMQRFFQALEAGVQELKAEVVVFVDEIDFVRSLPFSTDEFFAGIRESFNRRATGSASSLTFCLLGVATPSELIRDVQITPFNVGKRVDLTDFTLEELSPYARALSADGRDGRALVNRIHHWTGGHPYLTQKLSAAVMADAAVRSAGGVDRLVETLFFSVKARTEEPNLSDVARRVLEAPLEGVGAEEARARVLDLYHQVRQGRRVRDDETDPIASILKLSGLTRILEGYLVVRNRIYFRAFDRAWVESNLPDAEILRQRRAARAAAVRVGTLSGAITLGIAALAIFAFSKAAEANRATIRAESKTQSEALARQEASKRATEAETERKRANKEAELARSAEQLAEQRAAELAQEVKRTQSALAQAKAATLEAKRQERQAVAARGVANARELEANRQRRAAEVASQGEREMLYLANINLITDAWSQQHIEWAQELLAQAVRLRPNGYRPELGYWQHRIHGTALMNVGSPACLVMSGNAVAHYPTDSRLQIMELSTRRVLQTYDTMPGTTRLVPSSTTNLLVGLSDKNASNFIHVWNLPTGHHERIATADKAEHVAFSPDDSHLLIIDRKYTAYMYDVPDLFKNSPPAQSFKLSPGPIDQLVLHQPSTLIVARGTTIEIWDIMRGIATLTLNGDNVPRVVSRFPPPSSQRKLSNIHLLPDGEHLLAIYRHPTHFSVIVWNIVTGKRVNDYPSRDQWLSAAVASPTGGIMAVKSSNSATITVIDPLSGAELLRLTDAAGTALVFDPSGRFLTYQSRDGLALFDIPQRKIRWKSTGVTMPPVAFTPDGLHIIAGDSNNFSHIVNAANGQLSHILPVDCTSKLSLGSAYVLVESSGGIWSTTRSAEMIEFAGQTVTASSDLERVARASTTHYEVFDARSRAVRFRIARQEESSRLFFTPDGSLLGIVEGEGRTVGGGQPVTSAVRRVRFYSGATGEPLYAFYAVHGSDLPGLVFSGDGKVCASLRDVRSLEFRNTSTGRLISLSKPLPALLHKGQHLDSEDEIRSFILDDTGALAVVVTDEGYCLTVSTSTGSIVDVIGEVGGESPDYRYAWRWLPALERALLIDGAGGLWVSPQLDVERQATTRIAGWNVKNSSVYDQPLAVSRDGQYLALTQDGVITVLELASGFVQCVLKGHRGALSSLAFSDDSSVLVSAGHEDDTILVWNIKASRQVLKIEKPVDRDDTVSFAADGRILVHVSESRLSAYFLDPGIAPEFSTVSVYEEQEQMLSQLLELGSDESWRWHLQRPLMRNFVSTELGKERLAAAVRSPSRYIAETALDMLEPVDAATLREFAESRLMSSDWDSARKATLRLVGSVNALLADHRQLALLSLAEGNRESYLEQARVCASLALNPNIASADLFQATIAVRVLPNVLDDYGPLLAAAERAITSDPAQYANVASPGILLHRMGRHEEALKRLEPSVKANNRFGQVFSAMALAKLGRLDEAKSMLETVVAWASSKGPGGAQTNLQLQRWAFRFELELLINEAKELLGVKKVNPIVAQLSRAKSPNLQSLLSPALSGGTL